MGLFDKLFKALRTKKTGAIKPKATVPKAAIKPASISTTPKIYQELGKTNILKSSAKELASSKIVKTAGKIGVGSVIIGGGVYGIGSLTGKGLSNIGYGWRGLTNEYTNEEIKNQQLDNMEKENSLYEDQLDTLKEYTNFLRSQGMTDTPSMREAYNTYVKGDQSGTGTDKTTGSTSPLLIIAGLAAAGAGIYILTKKKKKK